MDRGTGQPPPHVPPDPHGERRSEPDLELEPAPRDAIPDRAPMGYLEGSGNPDELHAGRRLDLDMQPGRSDRGLVHERQAVDASGAVSRPRRFGVQCIAKLRRSPARDSDEVLEVRVTEFGARRESLRAPITLALVQPASPPAIEVEDADVLPRVRVLAVWADYVPRRPRGRGVVRQLERGGGGRSPLLLQLDGVGDRSVLVEVDLVRSRVVLHDRQEVPISCAEAPADRRVPNGMLQDRIVGVEEEV